MSLVTKVKIRKRADVPDDVKHAVPAIPGAMVGRVYTVYAIESNGHMKIRKADGVLFDVYPGEYDIVHSNILSKIYGETYE